MKSENHHQGLLTIRQICDYNFSLDWQISNSRAATKERAIYFTICRELTTNTLTEIGSSITGAMKHDSVKYCLNLFNNQIQGVFPNKRDKVLYSVYEVIKKNAKTQLEKPNIYVEEKLLAASHIKNLYHEIRMLKQRLNDITA